MLLYPLLKYTRQGVAEVKRRQTEDMIDIAKHEQAAILPCSDLLHWRQAALEVLDYEHIWCGIPTILTMVFGYEVEEGDLKMTLYLDCGAYVCMEEIQTYLLIFYT